MDQEPEDTDQETIAAFALVSIIALIVIGVMNWDRVRCWLPTLPARVSSGPGPTLIEGK